jgi:hypothetical protein
LPQKSGFHKCTGAPDALLFVFESFEFSKFLTKVSKLAFVFGIGTLVDELMVFYPHNLL